MSAPAPVQHVLAFRKTWEKAPQARLAVLNDICLRDLLRQHSNFCVKQLVNWPVLRHTAINVGAEPLLKSILYAKLAASVEMVQTQAHAMPPICYGSNYDSARPTKNLTMLQ